MRQLRTGNGDLIFESEDGTHHEKPCGTCGVHVDIGDANYNKRHPSVAGHVECFRCERKRKSEK